MPVSGPTPIATTGLAGKVKPDGSTVTVAADGTISAVSAAPTGAAGGDLTGTYPNPTVPGLATKATVRSVGATVTAAGALAANTHTPADATSAGFTLTLPTGQPTGAVISVEKTDSSTNAVTVSGNLRGQAAQTIQLILQRAAIDLIADASGSWWPFAGHHTLSSLDARYAAGNDTRIVNAAETNGANTFTGTQTAPALIVSGLSGATAASRYVGATPSGAPTSGPFLIGDFVIDQTATIYVCTVAGTPGTWAKVKGASHAADHAATGSDRVYIDYGATSPARLELFSRYAIQNNSLNVTSGNSLIGSLFLTYFTAVYDFTASNIFVVSATTATSVLPTSLTLGVYAVASNDGSSDNLSSLLGWWQTGVGITTQGTAYVATDAVTQTATSGAGTGFTATVSAVNSGAVTALQITSGGSGYAVGDTITLSNGHAGTNAVVRVLAVAAGVVTSGSALTVASTAYGGTLTSDGTTAHQVSFVRGTRYALGFDFVGSGTPSVWVNNMGAAAISGLAPAFARHSAQFTYMAGIPTSGFAIAAPAANASGPWGYFT